jgi:predicted ArsR family transcriptional regulator
MSSPMGFRMSGMTTERDENGSDDQLEGLSHLKDSIRLALYRSAAASHAGVSRDEAAHAVGISRSLAAYHLDKLVEVGLLEARFERRSGRQGPGAGRPAKIYVASRRQFQVSVPPRDYQLAAQLLAEALDSDTDAPPRAALRDRARILGGTLGAEARRRCAHDRTVECLRDVLAARGYEPYDDDGVVRLRNCPFHTLAAQHRDLVCGMNLAVLEGMIDALGADTIRPRLDPRPDECCVAFEPTRPAVIDKEKT